MKGGLCKIFQVSKYQVNTGYLHEVLGLVGHGFWVNVKLAILHRCSRPVSVGHMTKLWERETKNNLIWFNEGQTPNGILEKASITNFHKVLIFKTIATNAPRICFLQRQECQNFQILFWKRHPFPYSSRSAIQESTCSNPCSVKLFLYMQDNSFNMICFRSDPLCRCRWEPM